MQLFTPLILLTILLISPVCSQSYFNITGIVLAINNQSPPVNLSATDLEGTVRNQNNQAKQTPCTGDLVANRASEPYSITPYSLIRFFGNSVGYNGTETITAMAFYTKSSPILTITPIQMPVQCDDSSFKTKMFCQSPDDFSQIKSGSVWISKYLRIGILQAIPTDGLGITIQLQLKPPSGDSSFYSCTDFIVVPASTAVSYQMAPIATISLISFITLWLILIY